MFYRILFHLSICVIITNGFVIQLKKDEVPGNVRVQPKSHHKVFSHKKQLTGAQDTSNYSQQPSPSIANNPSITSAQIPFGQYGFFPDYIQPITGPPTVMASYPNFDYINVLRPGLENFLFSPTPIYLTPLGDVWTGIGNEHIPVVWKPVSDYPFGADGNQPYRDIKRSIENLSAHGFPVHILEQIVEGIKKKKEKHPIKHLKKQNKPTK